MPSYIDEKTENPGFVAPVADKDSGERLHDGLSFVYRYASRIEMAVLDNKIRIATQNDYVDPECAVEAEKLAYQFVATHIRSWDLKNGQKEQVAITKENVGRIQPTLFARVYQIIRQSELSDVRPAPESEGDSGDSGSEKESD